MMCFFLTLFLLLVIRIGFIQSQKIVNGQDLQEVAESRWTQTQIITGKRGTIFDRNGSALAQEVTSYTIIAILDENTKNRVTDPRMTAEKLAPILERDSESLERSLSAEGRFQVELGVGTKNLDYETMKQIKDLELPGIIFRKEPKRYYPKHTFASHIIGYTERDMSTARMGLENSLDDYLVQKDGMVEYLKDRRGFKLPNIEEFVSPPVNGHDVYLTIDANIQTALEQVMTQVEERYEPERITAIVADPKTGQILAMGNRPSFNPNFYEGIVNYMNFAVSSRYEPGSTMKIFTLAAAIEEGVYNGEELFQSGSYQIGPDRIRDHQRQGWGKISFDEGFQRSSNVAFSILAIEKLGRDRFFDYFDKFGFREPTGIDLPNEVNSLVADRYRSDIATTAFGQATAVTPIQQIQAATAIANGGNMVQPYVVDRIVNPDTGEIIKKNETRVVGQPISAQTAKHVLNLMETVVTSPAGTGKPYYIEGFEIAGKTGTAEIVSHEGGYLTGHGNHIFSFLGVAPKSDPQLIVYVAVDQPKLDIHEVGSTPVSMIFNTVMKQSLQYLNISPSHFSEHDKVVDSGVLVNNFREMSLSETIKELEVNQLAPIILGGGNKIESQVPQAETRVLSGEKVFLLTDGETFEMPDIIGWSKRDVMKLSELLNLNINVMGSGFAQRQSVSVGNTIRKGDYLVVEFSPFELLGKDGDQDAQEDLLNDELERIYLD